MRSFVLSLSFLLLIFNMSLSPVEAEDKINKGILFQLKSVTIDGEPKNKCLHTQTASLSGYIQLNFREYGRFVFSAKQFPDADKVAEVYGDVLEVHTLAVDLVLEMWEPILRDADSGMLYFRHDPDYVPEYIPGHGCSTVSSSTRYGL